MGYPSLGVKDKLILSVCCFNFLANSSLASASSALYFTREMIPSLQKQNSENCRTPELLPLLINSLRLLTDSYGFEFPLFLAYSKHFLLLLFNAASHEYFP